MAKRSSTGKIFAANLKKVMADRGLTAKAAAQVAGVAPSSFAQWLAGSAPLDLEAVHRFSKGTNVSFQWLLIGRQDPAPVPALADLYDVVDAQELTGLFLISAKRLKAKTKT